MVATPARKEANRGKTDHHHDAQQYTPTCTGMVLLSLTCLMAFRRPLMVLMGLMSPSKRPSLTNRAKALVFAVLGYLL